MHKLAGLGYFSGWYEFYYVCPWWRIKQWANLLDENLEKEKGITGMRELQTARAIALCLGGTSSD